MAARLLVLIPTKTDALLLRLFETFRKTQPYWDRDPRLHVGVLDNGLHRVVFQPSQPGVESHLTRIPVSDPFVFSAAVNLGLRQRGAAWGVLLLNDDVEMVSENWLPLALLYLHQNPRTLMGVTVEKGTVGNPEQLATHVDQFPPVIRMDRPPGPDLIPTHRTICFLGALIPAAILDAVGELDERFTAYGWEDNDYSRRCLDAGFDLGVMRAIRVNHGAGSIYGMHSTFAQGKTPAEMHRLFQEGRDIYNRKWGSSPPRT